jgi:hypothetical protein
VERTTRRFAFPLVFIAFSVLMLGALGNSWLEEPLVVRPVVTAVESVLGAVAVEIRSDGDEEIVLGAPEASPGHGGTIAPPRADHAPPVAVAYQFMAPVYRRPSFDSSVIGRVRRGTTLPGPSRAGKSCKGGSWYRIGPGFICSGEGFHVRVAEPFVVDQKLPALDLNVPYAYAEVTQSGAPRFFEVPSVRDLTEIEQAWGEEDGPPELEVVERYMDGDYFVAIDRREQHESGNFVRTVRGRWVHAGDVREVRPSTLVGEDLSSSQLPMAFVPAGDPAPLFRLEDAGARAVGRAEPYARAHVTGTREIDGVDYVLLDDGLALRRDDVRLATLVQRPEDVAADARWVHVDLDEQTLVAYEGDEPRYATLVASGKPGWDTPTGLHRIANKLAVFTMKGDDPREGYYEVEDVPWTMFYDGGYALHGAYWHDAFGSPRSHGCTNLSPADARFVYTFTAPDVPDGWQGRLHAKGSWVYLTRAGG